MIEAVNASIMAVREVDNLVKNARPIYTAPRSFNQALKQLMFDWKTADNYQELCNFEIEVEIFPLTNCCSTQESKGPDNNQLARSRGSRFVQTSNDEQKEKCRTSMGLVEVLSERFKPQQSERILSLLYCKLNKRTKYIC